MVQRFELAANLDLIANTQFGKEQFPPPHHAPCPQTAMLTIQYRGPAMETAANLPQSVTNAFVRAMNRQDPDALAALMTPGHRFVDPLGNVVEGRERSIEKLRN